MLSFITCKAYPVHPIWQTETIKSMYGGDTNVYNGPFTTLELLRSLLATKATAAGPTQCLTTCRGRPNTQIRQPRLVTRSISRTVEILPP